MYNYEWNGFFATLATFGMIYVLLYAIKNDVNLIVISLVIVALFYVAIYYCPLVRHFVGGECCKPSKKKAVKKATKRK